MRPRWCRRRSSIIQTRFSGASRTRALSVYGAAIAIGGLTGQVLGGVLVDLDIGGSAWRSVFFVNVPVGILAVTLAARKLPRDEPVVGRVRDGLDLIGLATGSAAVLLIVLPMVLGREEGWPVWTYVAIASGAVLAVVFVLAERWVKAKGGRPLLDLDVVRSPGLPSALLALSAGMVAYGGFLFVFAFHLQGGLGDSALRAGLTFAPAGAAFGLVGFYWRRLPTTWHPWLPVVGFTGAALGYLAIGASMRNGSDGGAGCSRSWRSPGRSWAPRSARFWPMVWCGCRQQRAADASGLLTTVLQLSIVLGVTVFGDLFLSLSQHVRPHASAAAFGTVLFFVGAVTIVGLLGAVPLSRTVRRRSTRAELCEAGSPTPGATQGHDVLVAESVRVVVVEDHFVTREGLRRLLDEQPGVEVVGCAGDPATALELVTELRPDVVITDIRMPPDQHHGGHRARARGPRHPARLRRRGAVPARRRGVHLVVVRGRRRRVRLPAQAAGSVMRSSSSEPSRRSPSGGSVLDPAIVQRLLALRARKPGSPLDDLTEGEALVLRLMAGGYSNVGIAAETHLAIGTVEKRIAAVFQKLGLTDREDVNRRVRAVLLYLRESATGR